MPFVGGPNTYITNPRWRMAAILEKIKNRHIPAVVRTISAKFGKVTQLYAFDRSDRLKFEISKIQDCGCAVLKNRKNVMSQLLFELFRRNLAQ